MTDFKVGSRCLIPSHSHGMVARIMAIAEGYAMLRYPRCMPFVYSLKDLKEIPKP